MLLWAALSPHVTRSGPVFANEDGHKADQLDDMRQVGFGAGGAVCLRSRVDPGRMLDEFAALTGHHQKHAMRLLRAGVSTRRSRPRPECRMYDQAMREALIVVCEASDRICGKRLRLSVPILISAMERHGHL